MGPNQDLSYLGGLKAANNQRNDCYEKKCSQIEILGEGNHMYMQFTMQSHTDLGLLGTAGPEAVSFTLP